MDQLVTAQPSNCLLSLDQAFLEQTVQTVEEGEAFIKRLVLSGHAFHLEDDPAQVINGPTDKPLFSDEQTAALRKRVDELYALGWAEHECPIGYMLKVLSDFSEEVDAICYE